MNLKNTDYYINIAFQIITGGAAAAALALMLVILS